MASAKMNAAKLAAPKKKQHLVVSGVRHDAPPTLTTFSSDLLTPEEERELLTSEGGEAVVERCCFNREVAFELFERLGDRP